MLQTCQNPNCRKIAVVHVERYLPECEINGEIIPETVQERNHTCGYCASDLVENNRNVRKVEN